MTNDETDKPKERVREGLVVTLNADNYLLIANEIKIYIGKVKNSGGISGRPNVEVRIVAPRYFKIERKARD